jgi:hypothetical protein
MQDEPPVVDWTPESGHDPFTEPWQALTEIRTSVPYGPGLEPLPPNPWDGERYIVVIDRGEYAEDPAVQVATAPSIEVAVHIAETHNQRLGDATS